MNINLRALAATSAALIASASMLPADTILWYRFEEHEPGYTMSSTDRVTNEVDAATLLGEPKTKGSAWPAYAATPQGLGGVYDPVSGKVYPNKTSLRLPNVANNWSGSYISVPDDEALHLQAFTIEMFARRTKKADENGPTGTLFSKERRASDHQTVWKIWLAGQPNWHYFTVRYKKEDGSFGATTGGSSMLSGNILTTMTFWDHIAIVVDVPNKSCKVFRNYAELSSYTIPSEAGAASIDYGSENLPLQIGSGKNYCFCGEIDEFRISDTALQPSQFLRLCSPVALPETTHLYTFDCATNFSWNAKAPWRNLAPVMKEASSATPSNLTYPTVGVDENVTPGNAVRPGLLADVSTENGASFHTSTNIPSTDASAAYFKLSGRTRFYATDFTFEMAFKVPPQPTSSTLPGANDNAAWLAFAGIWGIRFIRPSGQLHLYYAGADYNFGRYTDNEWHKLAYVFEKASGEHRFYIDGVQKFARTSARNADSNNYWYLLGEGNAWGGGQDLSTGWIDDVRVTEKALRPCEFLTSDPKEEGNTLAWYSFENGSLANGAYDDVIGAGALAAYAGGTPAFSAKRSGDKAELWDSAENKIRDNTASLAFAGGKAVWPRNSLLEREDLTVEFFARQRAALAGAGLVSLLRSAGGTNSMTLAESDAMWSIRIGNDGRTPEVYVNNGTAQTVAFPASAACADRWRHYAVVFAPSGDDTTVKLFCDHALVKTGTITGMIQLPSPTGGAIPILGATTGSSSGAAFTGFLDEVRISLGEVAVAHMLYAPPPGGTIFFVR